MEKYNFKKIEQKWQKYWEKNNFYRAQDFSKKPKYYCLIEFPYPSAEGLHVGHTRSYTAMDIIARKRRMQGYNVLNPIGWDAFGLPTENYAIKTGIHPKVVTKKNTDNYRRQLKSLGFSFDWSREINTTDPEYYKWTQWIFLQLYKKGLAYKKKMPINWCLSCKTGLANEEVIDGKCERCGGETEKREKEQWMLAITKYADRLLKDLDNIDYLEKIKVQQTNWIGKSEGATIKFQIINSKSQINSKSKISNSKQFIEVFTTRVDTIFGCTYLVVAPEHIIIKNLESRIKNLGEVEKYINQAKKKSDLQRTELVKEKTGVELKGVKAINPFNNEEVPIFVADYVLASYGTGAVMAVPAHDERDFEFAKKFNLLIEAVVMPITKGPTKIYSQPPDEKLHKIVKQDLKAEKWFDGIEKGEICYPDDGYLKKSGQFTGLTSEKARQEMTKWLEKSKLGKKTTQYKLRDWIFSRQHYWGEPIPIIYCRKCLEKSKIKNQKSKFDYDYIEIDGLEYMVIPVAEKDLPVELPEVKKYEPTDTGESPLANIKDWVNVKCPKCKGQAKRETDTMPNWAGSSWYYLAYLMRGISNFKFPISKYKKVFKYWTPVDWYNGGMEHTTLHLLYSRFWNKFLYDIKVVPTSEPYKKRTSHGMILGEDGEKMSKSRGNVVNPDDVVVNFGVDAFRLYQMFIGPFEQATPWDPRGIEGTKRFLGKIWDIQNRIMSHESGSMNKKIESLLHKTIKKVGDDIEEMGFNTAVSSLMIFINKCYECDDVPKNIWEKFLIILSPFA
ncbi:MAG TPA: leucine--tRNA ligase, partial [Candidatus Wolfebacteria bacterium]|nr:leucine--tRNA ligase [Candidatus Wolfebacteria bacterium]